MNEPKGCEKAGKGGPYAQPPPSVYPGWSWLKTAKTGPPLSAAIAFVCQPPLFFAARLDRGTHAQHTVKTLISRTYSHAYSCIHAHCVYTGTHTHACHIFRDMRRSDTPLTAPCLQRPRTARLEWIDLTLTGSTLGPRLWQLYTTLVRDVLS